MKFENVVNCTCLQVLYKKFILKIINIEIMKISYETSLMVSILLSMIIQIHTLFVLYQQYTEIK